PDPPPSQASQLPHLFVPDLNLVPATIQLWEPGLPAMAVGQLRIYSLTHRFREQARSHILF
ncbi:hypothetical protein, partial [Pseudomonas salomonii]